MAYISSSAVTSASGAPFQAVVTLTATAGDDLILEIAQSGTGVRTYTVSDTLNGSYGAAVVSQNPSSTGAWVFRRKNSAAGALTITVTPNTGTAAFDVIVHRVAGLDQTSAVVVSSFASAAALTHYCAEAAGVELITGTGGFYVTASALSGSTSTQTKHASFTAAFAGAGSGASSRYFQIMDLSSAFNATRGEWVQTGTARTSSNVIAAFAYTAGGGGGGGGSVASWGGTWFGV